MLALLLAQTTGSGLTLSPTVIALLLGTVIPVLTGLATKLNASDQVKAIVAFVLSILVGVITSIVKINPIDWNSVITCVAAAFLANIGSYHGAWKPISSTNNIPGEGLLPNIGIGAAVPPPVTPPVPDLTPVDPQPTPVTPQPTALDGEIPPGLRP